MRGSGLGFLRGSAGSSGLTARTSIRPIVTRTIGSGGARRARVGNDGLAATSGSVAALVGRAGGAVSIGRSPGVSAGSGGGSARRTAVSRAAGTATGSFRGGGVALARRRAGGGSSGSECTAGASGSVSVGGVGCRRRGPISLAGLVRSLRAGARGASSVRIVRGVGAASGSDGSSSGVARRGSKSDGRGCATAESPRARAAMAPR